MHFATKEKRIAKAESDGHAIVEVMQLGWLDVCLRVESAEVSKAFYEGMGFHLVEGDPVEGWGVVANGEARIGLFETQFMEGDAFSLNFRGGDVLEITTRLEANGYAFEKPLRTSEKGSSASIRDPDGHLVFFDSAHEETR